MVAALGRALGALALLALVAHVAAADGVAFGKGRYAQTPAQMGDQRGLVIYDQGRETLIVQTVVEGAAGELAWVVPTPALVRVRDACEVDVGLFEWLDRMTAPTFKPVPRLDLRTWGTKSAGEAATAPTGVTVHEVATVGSHEITTLTSDAPNALVEWLTDHGYVVPDNARPVLAGYVSRGWAFTAVRVTSPEAAEPRFRLPPLALAFDADEPVFPLAISGISPVDGEAEVILYVIAAQRVEVANYPTSLMNIAGLGWFADPRQAYDDRLGAIAHSDERPTFVVEYCRDAPSPDRLFPHEAAEKRLPAGLDYPKGLALTRLRTRFGPGQYDEDAVLSPSEEQWRFRTVIQQVGLPSTGAYFLLVGVAACAVGAYIVRLSGKPLGSALAWGIVLGGFVMLGGYMPLAIVAILLGIDGGGVVSGFSLAGVGAAAALGCAAYLLARRMGKRPLARWLGIAVVVAGSAIALAIGQTV